MNENADRMSELIASSFDGSRAGSRLAASRPASALRESRPESAMSSTSLHRIQRGVSAGIRPSSAMSDRSARRGRPVSRLYSAFDGSPEDEGAAWAEEMEEEEGREKTVFASNAPVSSYTRAYSLRAIKWAPPKDNLFGRGSEKGRDLSATFRKPRHVFRPSSAMSRQTDEMSETSSHAGSSVPTLRVDFLLRQLRLLCYRKVKGNGSDVSVREIFRHFDSNKDEDEDGAGIDVGEFTSALQKLMLGTPEDGLVSPEEAACMFRKIDTNNGGTIDYREVAQLLSQPGWDHRLVARRSNVLL
jgi:Ca2+-binding EF-hand superfamily protein